MFTKRTLNIIALIGTLHAFSHASQKTPTSHPRPVLTPTPSFSVNIGTSSQYTVQGHTPKSNLAGFAACALTTGGLGVPGCMNNVALESLKLDNLKKSFDDLKTRYIDKK